MDKLKSSKRIPRKRKHSFDTDELISSIILDPLDTTVKIKRKRTNSSGDRNYLSDLNDFSTSIESRIEDATDSALRKERLKTSAPDISKLTPLSASQNLSKKKLEDDSVELSETNKFLIHNKNLLNKIRSDLFQDLQHLELAESNYY